MDMLLTNKRFLGGMLGATLLTLGSASSGAAEPGLATLMERMQTYTHKLQLSITARNAPLAGFYLHELEETAEFIAEHIESYHDQPIGQLTEQMLMPAVELLEDAVDDGDWAASDQRFGAMLEACNACHVASGHGAVRIVPASGNPFAQDFSVIGD
jgi:cytochrome c553